MKEIYNLSINITEGNVIKYINAFYEDYDRARKELDRWGKIYKDKWNVPDEPDGVIWTYTESKSEYRFIGRPNDKFLMYTGHVFNENFILEEGEEIQDVSGCVFRYVEFPNICGYNYGPSLIGDNRVYLRELIDVERKVRITERIYSKEGVEKVSTEDENRYYDIRAEINNNR